VNQVTSRRRSSVAAIAANSPPRTTSTATREIAGGDARVLILTTFDLDEYVYDALAAGASGFLLKDVGPEQLSEGIRVVASGDALLAPTVTRRLIDELVSARRVAPSIPPALSDLTPREREVLQLVAQVIFAYEAGLVG
jgi:DNA-binding NarL/FixJ family response regulator